MYMYMCIYIYMYIYIYIIHMYIYIYIIYIHIYIYTYVIQYICTNIIKHHDTALTFGGTYADKSIFVLRIPPPLHLLLCELLPDPVGPMGPGFPFKKDHMEVSK